MFCCGDAAKLLVDVTILEMLCHRIARDVVASPAACESCFQHEIFSLAPVLLTYGQEDSSWKNPRCSRTLSA
eukprot:767693-Hanusia_phi.AAC.6